MIIKNGLVFDENCIFTRKDLYVEHGKIVASPSEISDVTEIDAKGCYVIPGLVDIHSHGAMGHDFSDADSKGLQKVLEYEGSVGVTSYCPTSMTLPKEELNSIFSSANFLEGNTHTPQAHLIGFNMEGPFLDPKKKGAHVEEYIHDADVSFFRDCNRAAGGRIRLVTLAPNISGADSFIKECHEEVTISLGHTSADYACCLTAMKNGASHVTHLYNAMAPFNHRDPGLIGAATDTKDSMVELICDGIHIHPSVIRATFALFGPKRVCLISDSMRACGMADGSYTLGGQKVNVSGKKATLEDGTIAGSVTNLYDCMRTAVSFGIPLEDSVAAATLNPAKSIHMEHQIGSFLPGNQADIIIMNKDLSRKQVLIAENSYL